MKRLLHNILMQTNEEMKMIKKYSCYEYEITGRDIGTDSAQYDYVIYLNQNYLGQDECIESDEWYETAQEAIEEACNHIDKLENGPDEPDYDAPTAHETYMKAHDDRQKLRGY